MKVKLDISKYFQGIVGSAVLQSGSCFAQVLPDVIADSFPDLSLLYLENNIKVLEDKEGKRYKVWYSKTGRFDVYPSYTKGFGRSKSGSKPMESDMFILAQKVGRDVVTLQFVPFTDLRENGFE